MEKHRNTVPPALPLKVSKICSSIKTHQPVFTVLLPLWRQDFPSFLVTATAVAVALARTEPGVSTWPLGAWCGHCHWQAIEVVQCFPLHCLSHTPWAAMRIVHLQHKCLLKIESNCALKQGMKRNLKILIVEFFTAPPLKTVQTTTSIL